MNPPHQNWASPGRTGIKTEPVSPPSAVTRTRPSSDSHKQSAPSAYPYATMRRRESPTDTRPHSSGSGMSTSSLAGAMGDVHMSHELQMRPSSSPHPSGMVWSTASEVPAMQDPFGLQVPFQDSPTAALASGSPAPPISYQDYNSPSFFNNVATPDSLSPASPAFTPSSYPEQQYAAYAQPRRTPSIQAPPTATGSMLKTDPYSGMAVVGVPQGYPSSAPVSRYGQPEDEMRALRKRVKELELINESARMRIRELEMELAKESPLHAPSHRAASGLAGLPSPASTPASSPSFEASWNARTQARIKQFCSLNRAGNALCAWHDSRRERRAYPPRNAPPGHLNCGCSYEEALFEESLARHGVGSYHPGESVRMDPALRNPLLKLLQKRYNYRDGDFERDPVTGGWVEGEGHMIWEQRANAGPLTRKTSERR
ncbi:hypothetical protein PUNSTDRAFT_102284 [Punctularia strigosozonata HHB-11173 SS5]|uniref:uncharacterized protein n=1 Tax=Punctularia strigosozonata (strain HHB-11173) TaxID=741275 RepID=UPI0004417A18|nr:uncharacterized protein PUNSTDRAFT_102284 [Punctularia strigosozonata HHB-11173 SS5]EIN08793.1 hypothetical protein PUNSTDRAFT_102284 [Punctularia strigosozonata HHB-11173 SS5]